MKLFNTIKRVAKRGMTAAIVTAAMAGMGLAAHVGTATAASCDQVNIVYCGVNGGSDNADIKNLRDKYNNGTDNGHKDLKAVYRWAGATDASIAGMNVSNTKLGTLYRNGDVKVGGKTVATNSWVSARFGAGQKGFVHVEGDVYARLTTTSFAEASAPVVVHFNSDGTMAFAVMVNCGNAIKGHPTPPAPKTPNYTITKEVSVKDKNDFHAQIKVEPGTHVVYRVTVASTGDTAVKNVLVKDNLPAAAQYVNNSLVRDGKAIGDKAFFNDGYTISSLNNGDKTVFKFEAIIGAKDTLLVCKDQTIDNVASITSKGLKTKKDTAEVNKKCQPKPEFACKNLTATPGDVNTTTGVQKYTLKAVATAKNATVVKYDFAFGDGSATTATTNNTSTSVTHTYAPGNYTASVSVTFKDADGTKTTVTSPDCKTPITVKPLVALSCDSLTDTAGAIDASGNQAYSFAASATVKNTTITGFSFDFGDGTAPLVVATSATTATANHTYAPGDYTARVTVTAAHSGKATSDACTVKIHVAQPKSNLVCKSLDLVAGAVNSDGSQSYTLNASASADHATITSYVFNFGDASQTTTVNTGNTTASTQHVYKPGTWTATVTVNGKDINGHAVSSTNQYCQKTVTVKPAECQPGVPSGSPQCFTYTCNAFTVASGDNRTVTVASFNATTNNPNATLSNVVVDWGDNSTDLEAAPTAVVGQQHQYDADGTYTITAVAHFTVDGQDQTASGANCTQSVSFTTPGTPPVTPPTELVNTGAGSTLGIFAAVAVVSAIAHRLFLRRKLSA